MALSLRAKGGVDESRRCCRPLPIEGGSLHRWLARVAKHVLPSRVDLVSIFLECEEDTRDFLMRLRLDDIIEKETWPNLSTRHCIQDSPP
jgi:hypothetical protein